MVVVDASGNLVVTPAAGCTVFVQGMDVPAAVVSVNARIQALATTLQVTVNGAALAPEAGPTAASAAAPWVGLDPQGNMLLLPPPSSTHNNHASFFYFSFFLPTPSLIILL